MAKISPEYNEYSSGRRTEGYKVVGRVANKDDGGNAEVTDRTVGIRIT